MLYKVYRGKPVIEKAFKFQVCVLIVSFISFGCSRASDGFAPSAPIPLPPPDTTNQSHFKYGETVTTSGGWEASLDTTDPTEQLVLANGWTIEVKYE